MRKYILFAIFLLLIPVYLYATDGVSGVEHPAAVNSVATPDTVCGVSGLAAGGGTAYFGYSSSVPDATDEDTVVETNGDGKFGTYLYNNDSGQTGTLTKLRVYIHGEYTTATATAWAIYANNAGALGSLLVRFNAVDMSGWSDGYNDITSMADSAPTMTNGVSYWVMWWQDGAGSSTVYSKASPTVSHKYGTHTYNFAAWPADGDIDDTTDYYKPHIYLYFDY